MSNNILSLFIQKRGSVVKMKYPLTLDQISKAFEEATGCKISSSEVQLLEEFADIVNSAYQSGIVVGESHIKGVA
jgi:hypothetical protein